MYRNSFIVSTNLQIVLDVLRYAVQQPIFTPIFKRFPIISTQYIIIEMNWNMFISYKKCKYQEIFWLLAFLAHFNASCLVLFVIFG